jgi:Type II secretion system (T2SS), protein M subtype b
MTSERKRQAVLLGLILIVSVFIAMDRLGGGLSNESDAVSAKTEYLREAELAAQMQGFIDAAFDWQAVQDQATEQWRQQRSRMIVAQTAELANAKLQQRLTQIVADLGVTLSASSTPSVRTPIENEPLRVIGLSLSIQAPSPDKLNAFLDRIEHMPEARVNIRRIQTLGPRRVPVGELDVQLDLEALAWITQEANNAPAG